ncbi:hypothetical protein BDN72DRAFT_849472 [Pluteus cervinus]|uniref:Uncharacterized protein n=1 Tax=Pluteus cervinus TaxID=181527 RepID=A0ACD3AA16_9AGAR|nr:hypothetical protein BDN72DRAFT_849472 [Pluteus cervinus]
MYMSSGQSRLSQIWPGILKTWNEGGPNSTATTTGTPHVFDIPPELAEEIIAHIPAVDEASIRSLALVSRVFLNPCQRRLFNKLEIDLAAHVERRLSSPPVDLTGPQTLFVPWTASVPAYQRLRDIFRQCPHLVGYVRKLSLFQSRPQDVGEWAKVHPSVFADITASLSSSPIHTISLEGYSYFSHLIWNNLRLEVERNLYRVFSNPSVQTLVMVDVMIPKTFFHGFRGLKHFKLAHIRWAIETSLNSETVEFRNGMQQVQRPTSLYLVPFGELPRFSSGRLDLSTMMPETGFDLTDLEHVIWRMNAPDPLPLGFLTRLRPAKLRVLELEFFHVALNLSSFRALSQLTISHYIDNGAGTTTGIPQIIETVSSLPTPLHLHSLVLRFNNRPLYPFDQYSGFQVLSSTFSRLQEDSKSLETISIGINIYKNVLETPDEAAQLLLKDYVLNQVRWDGCEPVLEVYVRS